MLPTAAQLLEAKLDNTPVLDILEEIFAEAMKNEELRARIARAWGREKLLKTKTISNDRFGDSTTYDKDEFAALLYIVKKTIFTQRHVEDFGNYRSTDKINH